MVSFIRKIFRDFGEDQCGVRAAALAYYTIFALPPLLILLVLLVGLVWDTSEVQRALETQFANIVGPDGGAAIRDMLAHAKRPGSGGVFATALGVGLLMFGAVGAFMQLQEALNRAWEVRPDPSQGGNIIKRYVLKRLLSLGMILCIAFLLIVSLSVSALLSALSTKFAFPHGAYAIVDIALSFSVLTVMFAAIYKFLPDAEVEWRDVWAGAVLTAILFVVGKFVIGFYLGRSAPGDAYGAAGALAIILVWVYYAGMIVLFGAEFTQAWAERRGAQIKPEKGAIHIEHYEVAAPPPR